ncbi:MAG: hypothetical protein LBV16_06835 [Elusimicrobiota bacterium]|jgi:hypothetical protein|nr:hypothetical protein [Elusimicrobiota bacterium]
MKAFKILTILIIAAFLGACASAPKKAVLNDDSNPRNLTWLGKTWAEGSTLYAGGISGESDNLQQARQQAYSDALRKIAEYSGITVSNNAFFAVSANNASSSDLSNMSVEETSLSKAQIKEFEYGKTQTGKFVGYALVQYDMRLLEEEKKRKEELEKQRKQEMENRKKLGKLAIIAPQKLNLLVPDLKQFLQSEGYLIAETGDSITVSLINEEYIEKGNLWLATIKTEFNLKDKIIVSQASGVGKTKYEALTEAVKRWIDYFKDDYKAKAKE